MQTPLGRSSTSQRFVSKPSRAGDTRKKTPFKEILLLVEKAFQGRRLTTQREGKPHKAVEGVCARTRCGMNLNASQRGRSGRRPPAAAVTKAADVCTAATTSGTLQVLSHWHSEAAAIRARGAPSELQRSCYLYGRPVDWRAGGRAEEEEKEEDAEEDAEEDVQTGAFQHLGLHTEFLFCE